MTPALGPHHAWCTGSCVGGPERLGLSTDLSVNYLQSRNLHPVPQSSELVLQVLMLLQFKQFVRDA